MKEIDSSANAAVIFNQNFFENKEIKPVRIGTLLNTYRIVPKVLHDAFGEKAELTKKMFWVLRHSPDFLIKQIAELLGVTESGQSKLDFPSLVKKLDLSQHIEELRQAGATHFELSGDLVFLLPELEDWWKNQLPYLISLRQEGITYSVHLPQFAGLNIDSYLGNIRAASVREIRRINELCAPLEPYYVLHLGTEPFFRYLDLHLIDPTFQNRLGKAIGAKGLIGQAKIAAAKLLVQELMQATNRFLINQVVNQNTIRSLREIQEFLPLNRLCLENLEYTDFDAVMEIFLKEPLLSQIPVSVCLDTGHLIIQKWKRDPRCFEKFFNRYGERLAALHIHDALQTSEEVYDEQTRAPVIKDHQPLGTENGLLPLRQVLDLAKRTEEKFSKNIPLVIELYYHDPLSSIKLLKQLIQ